MPRLLHTADWQIGRQFGQFPTDEAVLLAQARITTVERIAKLATELSVDAVLVAGDVFDVQTVPERTLRRLFHALEGYAGPWMMISGNHDAALAESVWTRARRLGCMPSNLQVLDRPGVTTMADIGCAFLAAPLTQRHTYDDLTQPFDRWDTPPGLLRIGLAHGSVQGLLAEAADSANPIAADRASQARLDYLALGDWHGMKCIDDRTWYSGTPEPDRFRDNDAGRVLEVRIDAPGASPVVTPHRIGQYTWRALQVDLAVSSDVDRLAERLGTLGPGDVVRLELSGRVDLESHARLERLLAQATARAGSLQVDRATLHASPTEADLAGLQLDGYLAEVLVDLRTRQSAPGDEDARVASEALSLLAGLLAERRDAGSA